MFECGRLLFDYLSEIAIEHQNDTNSQKRLRNFCMDETRIDLENDKKEIEEINRVGVTEQAQEYTPTPKPVPSLIQTPAGASYTRDRKVALNALARANHHCEINPDHPSFVRKGILFYMLNLIT